MKWYWWLIIAVGPLIGLAGAAYGTMNSIKLSKGPRERAFVIRMSLHMSLGLAVFLAILLLVPQPWNYLVWIPYGIALPLSIRYFNRRQQEIREQEGTVVV